MSELFPGLPRKDLRKGRTALHFAMLMRDIELVQALIADGIDVGARDDEGYTAAQVAMLSPSTPETRQ
ncbi:MAG: ankyrin repeat domain-containing protein [Lysobacteraceae bacterium]